MIHWHWNEVFHIFYITKINESMFPRRSKKLRMNRNDQNYNIRNLLIAQYSCRYHRRNLLPSTASLASQLADFCIVLVENRRKFLIGSRCNSAFSAALSNDIGTFFRWSSSWMSNRFISGKEIIYLFLFWSYKELKQFV